jgi:hypothetical protein
LKLQIIIHFLKDMKEEFEMEEEMEEVYYYTDG